MAREFLAQFHHHSFTVGQTLVFSFQEKKMLALVVKELEGTLSALIQTLFTH
jgi:vesicle-fusing ATPase